MKISLKGKATKEKPQPVMELEPQIAMGRFELYGTDGRGVKWAILTIDDAGIHVHSCIAPNSEWPLDESGRLHVITE